MKKVSFDIIAKKDVLVTVDNQDYGKLDFDNQQNAWVLWPNDIDDGVTYYESLEETEDQIKFELQHADN